jgi:hypothetical protein
MRIFKSKLGSPTVTEQWERSETDSAHEAQVNVDNASELVCSRNKASLLFFNDWDTSCGHACCISAGCSSYFGRAARCCSSDHSIFFPSSQLGDVSLEPPVQPTDAVAIFMLNIQVN